MVKICLEFVTQEKLIQEFSRKAAFMRNEIVFSEIFSTPNKIFKSVLFIKVLIELCVYMVRIFSLRNLKYYVLLSIKVFGDEMGKKGDSSRNGAKSLRM